MVRREFPLTELGPMGHPRHFIMCPSRAIRNMRPSTPRVLMRRRIGHYIIKQNCIKYQFGTHNVTMSLIIGQRRWSFWEGKVFSGVMYVGRAPRKGSRKGKGLAFISPHITLPFSLLPLRSVSFLRSVDWCGRPPRLALVCCYSSCASHSSH